MKAFITGLLFFLIQISLSQAQNCPPNIDFETASFTNWDCQTGFVYQSGNNNIISVSSSGGPIAGRHTIFSRVASAGQFDIYGSFPVTCPNGSGYSVKLGNSLGGHEAESVSYQFTIPANRNTYSLVYYYAVVFENPNHLIHQQPRLEIDVRNISDNEPIDCSSFTFIPFGSPLPGFFVSPIADSVYCKDWTPVTINLDGKAGKTIRISFTTADCVFNRHFGYAYVDVNTECSGEFTGAAYCKDDTAVNVKGPYGFQGYRWFDAGFNTILGTGPVLTLQPPPPPGTQLALELTPYNGYGCVDTMFATLVDSLNLKANAGADGLLCGDSAVTVLGELPKDGVIYHWSPAAGLSDSTIANPIASPPANMQYILNIRNSGGGCRSSDTVQLVRSNVDTSMSFTGKQEFCITSNDSAVFTVNPINSVQWFQNGQALNNQTKPRYKAPGSGTYYARLLNTDGCIANTRSETVRIEIPARGITYPLLYTIINDPLTLKARDFQGIVVWQPPQYLNDASAVNPVFNSPVLTEQTYRIRIISRAGCETTDFQTVKVIREVKIYIPSAFTPNGDGLNDLVYPITEGAHIQRFSIFNRWGRELFNLGNSERGWDGIFNGQPQDTGTYVWYLEAQGIDRKLYKKTGTIILIR